ncbi:MAG: 8-amino-7-oxononanoate synthase [Pseudomonadota bacterium]|jgi:8-amino-7-oxononanoate synthase
MPDPIANFSLALDELDAQHLRRHRRVVTPIDGARVRVDGVERLAFCSNDYLGLAQHPALIEAAHEAALRWGVGAGASPLVSGHSPEHEALETELAAFVGLPRALYFYAGYAANSGCIPALVGKGDALIADALNHACLIDGARLSTAERHIYPHNDLAALEQALVRTQGARRRLVVADAVFSMDGDVAPIPQMLALCERYDALLLVDDAHGFGVLGEGGRGTLSHFGLRAGAMPARLIYMATLGKAAGVSGAFVAGAAPVIEWLLQKARTYMFATAAPAMVAAALRASLRVIEADQWRRERLATLHAQLAAGLATLPWPAPITPSAIQPLMLGDNASALAVMAALDAQGLWVPAIRPPTVPAGTARLRITLSAAQEAGDVELLLAGLRAVAG